MIGKIIQISTASNNSGYVFLFALDDEGKIFTKVVPGYANAYRKGLFDWKEVISPPLEKDSNGN